MSHWQTGKLDLKCSLNILKKALINIMPAWEKHIVIDDTGNLTAAFHGGPVSQKYQLVIPGSKGGIANLYSDIGIVKEADGSWSLGGDYSIDSLKTKLTSEVMRMKAIAIAKLRGYEIIRNEDDGDEMVTDIRVDSDKAKELLHT